jgi:hypothetical protein
LAARACGAGLQAVAARFDPRSDIPSLIFQKSIGFAQFMTDAARHAVPRILHRMTINC